MPSALAAVILVVVLPAFLFAARIPALRAGAGRRVAIGLGVVLVLATIPWGGIDFVYLKRLTLVLAILGTAYCALGARRERWRATRRRRLLWLGALAGTSMLVHTNFFAFHGAGTFVHLHDVAHYYLGSKYIGELGYRDLYIAMLRAEAELYENRFHTLEARDLESYHLVHVRTLLERSEPVKRAFTPERWQAWKSDVRYFRDRLGPLWGTVLADHGFNPTPVWALLGGSLANAVPAGSPRGILALTLLDPLLLAATALLAGWAFGIEAALLLVVHFCVIYGASFGWIGGAFLRHLWFACTVGALSCVRRGWYAPAGAMLGLATSLTVFPAAFAAPIAFAVASRLLEGRRPDRRHVVFLGASAVTIALLFGATGTLPRGFGHWSEFRDNMARHVENISPNVVGLLDLTSYRSGPNEVTQEELDTLVERHSRIYRAQLVLCFLPTVWLVWRLARRASDVERMLLGLPLVFTGLTLAAYYYAFLVLVTLARSRRARDLAVVLGLEAATHALLLFEEREAMIHLWRSVMILELLVWLWLPEIRRELVRVATTLRARPSAGVAPPLTPS